MFPMVSDERDVALTMLLVHHDPARYVASTELGMGLIANDRHRHSLLKT